jgi:hypothetical protein
MSVIAVGDIHGQSEALADLLGVEGTCGEAEAEEPQIPRLHSSAVPFGKTTS